MKIEKTTVYGFGPALRGMRNPMDSWERSDSYYGVYMADDTSWDRYNIECEERPRIGPNDLSLAQKLIRNGSEHSKFLRTINVWADMTLPIYVWREIDTYVIGRTLNSCSTMHKLGHRDIAPEDFEDGRELYDTSKAFRAILEEINDIAREWRTSLDTEDLIKRPILRMKQLLPSSFLQKGTWHGNYAILRNMYFQRRYHRLPEWNIRKTNTKFSICRWIETLPYSDELITLGK